MTGQDIKEHGSEHCRMANYCIFRSKKLKTHQDVTLVLKEQHRAADYESKRADSSQSQKNSYSSDFDAAMKKYDDLLPAKIRKNAVVGLNFMVTTSEEFKTAEEEQAFYIKAREFIGKRFCEVVGWAIHRDETSTHMQIVTIPLVNGKLNARALIGGDKHKMHTLQDDFYEQVGQSFGLERGIRGSKAKHQSIQKYYQKLNERMWHYPGKGELPEGKRLLLIAITSPDGIEYNIAYYDKTIGFYLYTGHVDGGWDDVIGDGVLAWQYFPEPPEEGK